MKKNTKLLVISAAIVAVLGAALAAVLLIPSNKDEITLSDKNEILLFDKTGLIPEDITISNTGGDYQLLAFDTNEKPQRSSSVSSENNTDEESEEDEEESTLVYTMQDHPDMLLDKKITDDLMKQCLTQSAREIVDKTGSKYKDYGLEPPVASVSIRYSDGSSETLSLGNTAPGNEGVYMMTDKSKYVYLVQSSLANTFYIEKLQLFDKQVTPIAEDITLLKLSGEKYTEDIELIKNGFSCYDGYYVTDAPARYPCDTQKTNAVTNSLSEIKAVWVESINVGKDDIAKFGLDKPYQKLYIEADGGTKFTLIASKPNSDNIFYLMNTADTTVFSTYASENAWYNIDKTDLLYDGIFTLNRDEVKKAVIRAEGKTYEYTFEKERSISPNYYETEKIKGFYNGKQINLAKINTYLLNLSVLKWTETPAESTKGMKEILSVDIDYFVDEEIKDTLVLMRDNSGKTVAVLNGRPECYVDSAIADKLVSQAAMINGDASLESLISSDIAET